MLIFCFSERLVVRGNAIFNTGFGRHKIGFALAENQVYPRQKMGLPSKGNGYIHFYTSTDSMNLIIWYSILNSRFLRYLKDNGHQQDDIDPLCSVLGRGGEGTV